MSTEYSFHSVQQHNMFILQNVHIMSSKYLFNYFTVYRQLFYSALERRQPAIQPDSILISGECSSRENLHASHISSMDKTLTVNGSDTCAALPSVHCPKSNPIFRDIT